MCGDVRSRLNPKHLLNPLLFIGSMLKAVRFPANYHCVLVAQILSAIGAKGG
jgi:hypothetical protein